MKLLHVRCFTCSELTALLPCESVVGSSGHLTVPGVQVHLDLSGLNSEGSSGLEPTADRHSHLFLS